MTAAVSVTPSVLDWAGGEDIVGRREGADLLDDWISLWRAGHELGATRWGNSPLTICPCTWVLTSLVAGILAPASAVFWARLPVHSDELGRDSVHLQRQYRMQGLLAWELEDLVLVLGLLPPV